MCQCHACVCLGVPEVSRAGLEPGAVDGREGAKAACIVYHLCHACGSPMTCLCVPVVFPVQALNQVLSIAEKARTQAVLLSAVHADAAQGRVHPTTTREAHGAAAMVADSLAKVLEPVTTLLRLQRPPGTPPVPIPDAPPTPPEPSHVSLTRLHCAVSNGSVLLLAPLCYSTVLFVLFSWCSCVLPH